MSAPPYRTDTPYPWGYAPKFALAPERRPPAVSRTWGVLAWNRRPRKVKPPSFWQLVIAYSALFVGCLILTVSLANLTV